VSTDLRNEKIGFKIREHTLQKIPYLLVVGDKEVESGAVAVRKRGGEDLGAMTLDDFCDHLSQDVARFGRSDITNKAANNVNSMAKKDNLVES
jgi:threonyl-tRNA synthetase